MCDDEGRTDVVHSAAEVWVVCEVAAWLSLPAVLRCEERCEPGTETSVAGTGSVVKHVARLPFAALDPFSDKSDVELADLVGTHRRNVNRWRKDGLPVVEADRFAVAIGMTPFCVWGSEWEVAADLEAERRIAREELELERQRRKLKREWPWPDELRVKAHRCASDGCGCEAVA